MPDHATATNLFRIAQESVSNALKHGKAKQVVISLEAASGRIVLRVSDNGTGLPTGPRPHKGMGWNIMQSRAGMIGGTLAIERNARGGVTVTCSAPKLATHKSRKNHGR